MPQTGDDVIIPWFIIYGQMKCSFRPLYERNIIISCTQDQKLTLPVRACASSMVAVTSRA